MPQIADCIFILDLHNTLYDEVLEYSGAISAVFDFLEAEAAIQSVAFDSEEFLNQISAAHAAVKSDWDDTIWEGLPLLKEFLNPDGLAEQIIEVRRRESEKLTKQYAFTDSIQAVKAIKQAGAHVCIATEATSNAAADAVRWLGLDGVVDAVYSWPFQKLFNPLATTRQVAFLSDPALEDAFLQKPHPLLIAQIITDLARLDGCIPDSVPLESLFAVEIDSKISLADILPETLSGEPGQQIVAVSQAIQSRLQVAAGSYAEELQRYLDRCYYIGDSFFKDGFLAYNAGVQFVFAEYGKKHFSTTASGILAAKELLYRVTGWDPRVLQLTHEAGALLQLQDRIKPIHTCTESLSDLISHLESVK